MIQTLDEAAKGVVDPEKFGQLFSKLGKLEGAIGNMRGAFFELLVAEVVRKNAAGQVKLNKKEKRRKTNLMPKIDSWKHSKD